MQPLPDTSPIRPARPPSPLLEEIRSLIVEEGPIGVDRFMALALGHPRHGYYMTRDPFGPAGDFTTAPEISQMFGELLGLWAAEVWHGLGRPDPLRLVELGPGRGTLMADALRAARALPPFRAVLDVHLVETSPVLRAAQARTLEPSGLAPTWHAALDTIPDGPAIVLANEFFDALPIRQLVYTPRGWCDRMVGLDRDGALCFGLSAEPDRSLPPLPGPPGGADILEFSPAGLRIVRDLAARLVRQGGALLAIDYGHSRSGLADTLQALEKHRFVDVLAAPGEADVTAHVDFAALGRAASEAGGAVHGPVPQAAFLRALGIGQRARSLAARASPAQAEAIEAAVTRLTGPSPGMGELFKVMAVTGRGMPAPPGFPPETAA